MIKNRLLIIILLPIFFTHIFAQDEKIKHIPVTEVARMEADKIVNDFLWTSIGVLDFGIAAGYFALLSTAMGEERNPYLFWSLASISLAPVILEIALTPKSLAKSRYNMEVFGKEFSENYHNELKNQIKGRLAVDIPLGFLSTLLLFPFLIALYYKIF